MDTSASGAAWYQDVFILIQHAPHDDDDHSMMYDPHLAAATKARSGVRTNRAAEESNNHTL